MWVVWKPCVSILLKAIIFLVFLPWSCQTAFFAADRPVCVSGRLSSRFWSMRGNKWQTSCFLQPPVRGFWAEQSRGGSSRHCYTENALTAMQVLPSGGVCIPSLKKALFVRNRIARRNNSKYSWISDSEFHIDSLLMWKENNLIHSPRKNTECVFTQSKFSISSISNLLAIFPSDIFFTVINVFFPDSLQ